MDVLDSGPQNTDLRLDTFSAGRMHPCMHPSMAGNTRPVANV